MLQALADDLGVGVSDATRVAIRDAYRKRFGSAAPPAALPAAAEPLALPAARKRGSKAKGAGR